MENQHLTYFKVKNFKKFDSLEVKDIGQFNLIVGDNNVGKTCLLEALLVDEDAQQLLNNFYCGLKKRGLEYEIVTTTRNVNGVSTTKSDYPKENYFKGNFIGSFADKLSIEYNKKNEEKVVIEIGITNKEEVYKVLQDLNLNEYDTIKKTNYSGLSDIINRNDLQNQYILFNNIGIEKNDLWIYAYRINFLTFPFISFNSNLVGEEIIELFNHIKTNKQKNFVLSTLKILNSKIINIDFRKDFEDLKDPILFSFEDKDEFVPLNYLGDGFKRIFYIVLKAISLQGKRLMIDEIDIGIHHTKQKEFFINLFKICKELNIQLFATTHSKECAEAFVEASKEIEIAQNCRVMMLKEKNDHVKSFTLNLDEVQTSLNNGFEIRG